MQLVGMDRNLTFCTGATAAAAPLHSAFIVLYCAFTATAPEPVAMYASYAVWHCPTGPVKRTFDITVASEVTW